MQNDTNVYHQQILLELGKRDFTDRVYYILQLFIRNHTADLIKE